MIRLGTYKCQSELAGDQKLKKITSESQSQKLARKLSQADAVCWGCSMGVPIPIGGRTGQLLCGGGIAASRQCQIWPRECCGAVALYGGEKTAVTYKCQKRFLRRLGTYKCQSELSGDHMVVKKRRLPINVKNGF